ncbi:hypothetical protein BLA14095_01396 [Burkholderia lata]|uniref:hypothetical protein n=1 Tax=Burkholderia lata (strain ATCC 17760 / DSM 23089 / LMG 22485 / NCIMB 9086 / R18194 / 383) TaxID=482957 RepID=UPI00145379AA|nr:hypothetical protein [Burkholderia lata]VWB34923.1 hypothetical protein BLA14095_01396 [Burkholderia lata]
MKVIDKAMLTLFVVSALTGCGDSDKSSTQAAAQPPASESATHGNSRHIDALPFTIKGAMLSDLFKDRMKYANVEVEVSGGSEAEWASTAVAIAEKIASIGADSIEVTILRDEIPESHGQRFRKVAWATYSPDLKRTLWENDPQWTLQVADSKHLSTERDAQIYEEYYRLNEKFIDKGLDSDTADQRAGKAIAKKYKLQADWRLPTGNILSDFPRTSITVNTAPADAGLADLVRCLGGKITPLKTTCVS